jgi:hypothetical protein
MKIEEYREGLPVSVTESQDRKGITKGQLLFDGESKQRVYKCLVEIEGDRDQVIPIRRLIIRQGVKV